MKRRLRVRNAEKARNNFVTKRAENKLNTLVEVFQQTAGERWVKTQGDVLRREVFFTGFQHVESIGFIYNWESRFLSVNYNLEMVSTIQTKASLFQETGNCIFTLNVTQGIVGGLKGKRDYSWTCGKWSENDAMLAAYMERLSNPLITERLNALDIMEMEIRHRVDSGYWQISCESMIGSATWILIPPIFSVIMPKTEECIKALELFDLLADAVSNNR